MRIAKSVTELIGKTPLVRINQMLLAVDATLLLKLETANPSFSIKDRIALSMIEALEQSGQIKPNSVLIEATSGNTGIGLAMICAAKQYRLVLAMPDSMSVERQMLLKAYGAELVLTPGSEGMSGAVKKIQALAKQYPHYIHVSQFENPANPAIHRCTTAEEIWEDTEGKIDIFIAGVGTGGTITGVGEVLKSKKPSVQVIAVEPDASAVLSGDPKGPHMIQGIGAGFIPPILNTNIYDQIIRVKNRDALSTARAAAKKEGLLIGISSGATLWAGIQLAKSNDNKGKLIVAIAASSGERYLSTALYKDEF